jgi:DNA-binding MarR family transcriptional regulator
MELEKEIKSKPFQSIYEKTLVNIVYTASWLNSLHTKRLKPYDISPQQYNILRILRGQHPNPATVNLLQERMLDKMSNTSRLVEKLRLKGLVERHACPNDRRAVDIFITEAGLDLLAELDATMSSWEQQLRTLDSKEARMLNDLLDKLRG